MFNVGNCFFIFIRIALVSRHLAIGLFQKYSFSSKHLSTNFPRRAPTVLSVKQSITVKRRFCSSGCIYCILPCPLVLSTEPVYSAHCIFLPRHVYIFGRCLRCEFLSLLSPGQIVPLLPLTRTISRPRRRKQTSAMPTMIHSKAALGIWVNGPLMIFLMVSWSGRPLFSHFSMKNLLGLGFECNSFYS